MDAKDLFQGATEIATSCIIRVDPTQLSDPTPCTEWDLRMLLNHMVYEMRWVPDVLAGKTIAEVGDAHDGDVLGDDPASAWKQAVQAAREAVKHADISQTVYLSYGEFPAEHYIRESASDVLIHGWDVGQALHCSVIFDQQIAQAVYDFVLPRRDEFRQSGLFGEAVPTMPSDSIQTKLLALYGRRQNRQLPQEKAV